MRKGIVPAALAAALACLAPLSAGADTIVVGGSRGWSSVGDFEGVVVASGLRNEPVLALSSASPAAGSDADLFLSFDGARAIDAAGRYAVSVPQSVSFAGERRARSGDGAALFAGAEGGISVSPKPFSDALFAPGRRIEDFSIEFWLFPANTENGEQILSWDAVRRGASGESYFQRVRCLVSRNRIEWSFFDFFASPDGKDRMPISLSSRGALVPRTWSHHLIRFDSSLGLVEYLVDGRTEAAAYATTSGGEGGERYLPIAGSSGSFSLGPRFAGMMDEFKVSSSVARNPSLSRYPRAGGRATTVPLDLGTTNARISSLDADVNAPGTAEARFFLRTSDNRYSWKDEDWIPVKLGAPLPRPLSGRWAQISCVLYPDGSGEISPVVEELRLSYEPDLPPPPPSLVTASAKDGAVELKWRASPDEDLGGYLVYFGENPGEYFGVSTSKGESPLDVGRKTSFLVDGLRDGTLYYFAIAAYDRASPRHIGEFSRETTARPARTVR